MTISKEMQIGKIGEHLVCADLLKQGYISYLSDAGLNYDALLEYNNKIYRIQVKSTQKLISTSKSINLYRFGLKVGKRSIKRSEKYSSDIFAFVAIDINKIAYMTRDELFNKDGLLKIMMEFKTKTVKYNNYIYPNGTIRKDNKKCKYIEDYNSIDRVIESLQKV